MAPIKKAFFDRRGLLWLLGVVLLPILLYLVIFAPYYYQKYSLRQEGDQVQAKVEAYRTAHGQLPSNLSVLGIHETEEGPIYYQLDGNADYILWFGTTLGESNTYSSKTHQWVDY